FRDSARQHLRCAVPSREEPSVRNAAARELRGPVMLRPRVIPCLLLRHGALVKTVRFGRFRYIGDPANTCRIFNELEVDELALLDITASRERREPDYRTITDVADECFMPLSYGGGVGSPAIAERLFKI